MKAAKLTLGPPVIVMNHIIDMIAEPFEEKFASEAFPLDLLNSGGPVLEEFSDWASTSIAKVLSQTTEETLTRTVFPNKTERGDTKL